MTYTELLIILGMIIIFLWMIVITAVYFSLLRRYRTMARITEMHSISLRVYVEEFSNRIIDVVEYLVAYSECFNSRDSEAKKRVDQMCEDAEAMLFQANEKAEHARKTAQAARMLLNRMSKQDQPEQPAEDEVSSKETTETKPGADQGDENSSLV